MADKKLVDLPLETAHEDDQIYAVRDSERDIRIKLGDVMLDKVERPLNLFPENTGTGVLLKPTLVGSGYSPLYSSESRLKREFVISLATDVEFESPVFFDGADSDTIEIDIILESNTEYIWRCRDISVLGNESLWSAATSFTTTAESLISAPILISPADASENIAFRPTLVASDFESMYPQYTRVNRRFQVTNSLNVSFSNPVVDVEVNSNSYDLEIDLTPSDSYIWRCRDIATFGQESPWSSVFVFTVKAGEVVKPSVVVPSNGAENVSSKTVKSSEFAVIGGSDSLAGSEWEFYDIDDNLVHSSGLVSGVEYSYADIEVLTTYKVRVKHVGVSYGESEWSDFVEFTTGEAFFEPYSYLAIAHLTSPFVTIYKRSGDTFDKVDDPLELPTSHVYGASFSPDGSYLAIAHATSPFVTIYKRNGDTFTKLANPSQLPTGRGNGASFSPDGNYLAIAHFASPFVTIYKRNGDTFTKLANPSELPTGNGLGASFSPDGNYLAIAHPTSPRVTIYKRNGDTFTKLENPSQLPTGNGNGASFSPDGNYLAIAHFNSPYVTIYKRNGDTFDKVDDPLELPTSTGNGASFSLTIIPTPPPPPPTPGSIGTPGYHGFGVGICTNESWLTELGLSEMEGTNDYMHDNYGNYIHVNSSQMVFIPKFYYRIGNANHPNYSIFGANSLEIVGIETYETEAEANADGFILHRAFIDGGQEKIGFFIDKYHLSKKSDDPDVAVSVRYGVPISLTTDVGFTNSNGMPNCTGILADSLELCKARGPQYNQCSAFALSALAMLSLAHGQYATSVDSCAWFDPSYTTNFPKGCNNNALGDANDPTLTFISAGDSGNVNKPQCGSANNLAKTTHNGQNSGVADLNGAMFDLGLGITNFGTSATSISQFTNATLYVLKESVALASLTSGWNNPTDAWQSSGTIGTLYDQFTSQISLGTTGFVYWGNGNNQVFPTNLSGNNRAICGILGVNDASFSASGMNMFGNDYFYKYNRHNMFVIFGGSWGNAASAGVFCRYLGLYRSNVGNNVSPRGIAYGT